MGLEILDEKRIRFPSKGGLEIQANKIDNSILSITVGSLEFTRVPRISMHRWQFLEE